MKIAFYTHNLCVGGTERVIINYANYLVKYKYEITIICHQQEKLYQIDDKIKIKEIPIYGKNILKRYLRMLGELREYLRFTEFDVIFCPFYDKWINALLVKPNVTKIIGSERSNPYHRGNMIIKYVKKISANMLDGFIFQTEGAKNFYYKKTQKNSIILMNPINIKNLSQINQNVYESKVMIATGRLIKSKQYDKLLKIIDSIKVKVNDVQLIIVGDGPEKSNILQMIMDLRLQDNVTLFSEVVEIKEYLNCSSIFLFTSRYEGFPNGLIEAMATGHACVSYDCDFGPREVIKNGINGYLACSEEDFIESCIKLISDIELRRKIGKAAIDSTRNFDVHKTCNEFRNYVEHIYWNGEQK